MGARILIALVCIALISLAYLGCDIAAHRSQVLGNLIMWCGGCVAARFASWIARI